MSAATAAPSASVGGAELRRRLRAALPALSLALVIAAIAWLNPRAISYFGFTLMLNLAIPIALATIAQMFVIAGNDLDLSIGTFVGFVCCVSATWLHDEPWLGVLALIGCVALYAALGALIYLRNLPSIVVTLGMSFVWQGLAILLLPKPGGKAPGWLQAIMGVKPPFVPFPIVAAVIIAGVGYFGLMRTSYGAILRGSGGNALAIERAGWSLLARENDAVRTRWRVRRAVGHGAGRHHHFGRRQYRQRLYAALHRRRDPRRRRVRRRLVSPIGAVLGALTMAMAASPLLTFMHIPPDWQVAANGAILIIVLAARVVITRKGSER